MALTIDRAAISLNVAGERAGLRSPAPPLTDNDLRDRLRPLVLEILTAEIERLRREQG